MSEHPRRTGTTHDAVVVHVASSAGEQPGLNFPHCRDRRPCRDRDRRVRGLNMARQPCGILINPGLDVRDRGAGPQCQLRPVVGAGLGLSQSGGADGVSGGRQPARRARLPRQPVQARPYDQRTRAVGQGQVTSEERLAAEEFVPRLKDVLPPGPHGVGVVEHLVAVDWTPQVVEIEQAKLILDRQVEERGKPHRVGAPSQVSGEEVGDAARRVTVHLAP